MADLERDVLPAIAAIITVAVYPNGTGAPSVSGAPVQIVQGWPKATALDTFLKPGGVAGVKGGTIVSVYPVPSSTSKLPVPLAVLGGEFVVSLGVLGQIIDRQRQNVMISVWAPNQADRGIIGAAIDVAVKQNLTITMSDTTTAILVTQTTNLSDATELRGEYRRDLIVQCQWDTIETIPGVPVTTVTVQQKPWPLSS